MLYIKIVKNKLFNCQGTEYLEGYNVNVTKLWQPPRRCKPKRLFATETTIRPAAELDLPVLHIMADDDVVDPDNPNADRNNIIEGAARSKVTRSLATKLISLSSSNTIILATLIIVLLQKRSFLWHTNFIEIDQRLPT